MTLPVHFPLPLFALLLAANTLCAQARPEQLKTARRLFEGEWVNAREHRHLRLYLVPEGFFEANEWVGKFTPAGVDAYKVFVKSGIMLWLPEDKEEHIAPYCELTIVDKKLLVRCGSLSGKDTRLGPAQFFTRVR
jgi:hypothetical protein